MSKRFFSEKCTNTHWLSKRWKLGHFENAILVTKLLNEEFGRVLIHSMINVLNKTSLYSLTLIKIFNYHDQRSSFSFCRALLHQIGSHASVHLKQFTWPSWHFPNSHKNIRSSLAFLESGLRFTLFQSLLWQKNNDTLLSARSQEEHIMIKSYLSWEWITLRFTLFQKNNDIPPPAQSDQIILYLSWVCFTLRMPRTTLAEDPTIKKTGKKKPTWKFQ